jgi:hypothetical protein
MTIAVQAGIIKIDVLIIILAAPTSSPEFAQRAFAQSNWVTLAGLSNFDYFPRHQLGYWILSISQIEYPQRGFIRRRHACDLLWLESGEL